MITTLKKIKNQFIINSLKKGLTHFVDLPPDLINDKRIVLIALQYHGLYLKFVSNEFKDDYDVVMAAITGFSPSLVFASDNMKNNKNIVLAAVTHNGACIVNASDELKDDFDVALAAAKNHGVSISYISDRLKNNKEIVLAAIGENINSIFYASNNLRNDYDIALAFKNRYYKFNPTLVQNIQEIENMVKICDIIILNEQILKDTPINPIKNKPLKF